jgi:DNA-binding transcriptional LysR family regulator
MHITHDMRVDFNLFRVFAAIYTNGGVSAAAEVLHLTQPAVSHALARLRDQLGDPLFVRLGQGMVPTPVAHKLIGPVRKALGEIEQAVKAIESFDPALAAMQFRIGFNALMEAALFPRIVCEILPKAPGIRVEAVRYNRADMAMALASSQLNAVIDIEMANPGEMIHSRRLASGRIVGVARRDHPVVTGKAPVSLDDYMALGHIAVSTRPQGATFEDILIARSTTRTRRIAARCQLIGSALQLVRETDLVLTLASPFIDAASLENGLTLFDIPVETGEISICLYWHASNDSDASQIWLRECVLKSINFSTSPGATATHL